jgi:sugar lactone lactonase YvrE
MYSLLIGDKLSTFRSVRVVCAATTSRPATGGGGHPVESDPSKLATFRTLAATPLADVGEGPVWDPATGTLLWVDLLAGLVHRSELPSGTTTTTSVGRSVGAVARRRGEGLVLADEVGFSWLAPDGRLERELAILPPGHRMNDAKVDPAGRLWVGSTDVGFAPGRGALHVLEADGTVHHVLDGLTLPNGLGWSPEGDTFYLVDSEQGWLDAWHYDTEGGALAGRRRLASFDTSGGVPDGMCVDGEGTIWLAIWGGSRIERYGRDGAALGAVSTPVRQPSSCAFGGPRLATLYVTSDRRGLGAGAGPWDGALLELAEPGVRGLPVEPFAD